MNASIRPMTRVVQRKPYPQFPQPSALQRTCALSPIHKLTIPKNPIYPSTDGWAIMHLLYHTLIEITFVVYLNWNYNWSDQCDDQSPSPSDSFGMTSTHNVQQYNHRSWAYPIGHLATSQSDFFGMTSAYNVQQYNHRSLAHPIGHLAIILVTLWHLHVRTPT